MNPPAGSNKVRLDELVQCRLGVTRSQAQGLIRTGNIRDRDGAPLDRPGRYVPPEFEFSVVEGPKFVSRGGIKLESALDHFKLDVTGKIAVDVGASTGGFTDCLLQHGAARVFAVDVGYGQLDWRLREDPRVVVMERTNIRDLTPADLPERPNFFTIDCSFISLRIVLPAVAPLLALGAHGVALIKPQFEAGREEVGRGGVVRDAEIHRRVVAEVRDAAQRVGFDVLDVISSPLEGPAGNIEFLAHLVLRR